MTPNHVGDVTPGQAIIAARQSAHIAAGIEGLDQVELMAKGNLEIVMCTQTGIVPYNKGKRNQDRAVVKFGLQNKPHVSVFGVCDGHGEFGHDVAEFVQSILPTCLQNQPNLEEDPHSSITKGVEEMVRALKKQPIDVKYSGSTLVFGVKINDRVYCANIGDSRCVVIRQQGGANIPIALSEDQKPENPGEKERILQAGGRVEPLPAPAGAPPDCDRGPMRVWLADVDVPGLAMSRSIGDAVSQRVGVISVPEIREHTIDPSDTCVIWATDGVWEFIPNDEACEIVCRYLPNYQKACDELCKEATKRWKAEEDVVDDITCVILGFKPSK